MDELPDAGAGAAAAAQAGPVPVTRPILPVRSLGLVDGLFRIWMGAWLLSWMVAFPALLLVQPLVRRIMGWIVEKP